jgi:hypothetical protein
MAMPNHKLDWPNDHRFGKHDGGVVRVHSKRSLFASAEYGTSENAVKTQIWIAVSVYVLVAIVRKRLGLEASLYTLLQVISLTVSERMPLQSPGGPHSARLASLGGGTSEPRRQ